MKYWRVVMGNGLCGCDEEFLLEQEEEPTFEDLLDLYSYTDGFAGLDPYGDEEDNKEDLEVYEEEIASYTDWEEITEEEFNDLHNKYYLEIR